MWRRRKRRRRRRRSLPFFLLLFLPPPRTTPATLGNIVFPPGKLPCAALVCCLPRLFLPFQRREGRDARYTKDTLSLITHGLTGRGTLSNGRVKTYLCSYFNYVHFLQPFKPPKGNQTPKMKRSHPATFRTPFPCLPSQKEGRKR